MDDTVQRESSQIERAIEGKDWGRDKKPIKSRARQIEEKLQGTARKIYYSGVAVNQIHSKLNRIVLKLNQRTLELNTLALERTLLQVQANPPKYPNACKSSNFPK